MAGRSILSGLIFFWAFVAQGAEPPPSPTPRLVVVIVVDQLGYEVFNRLAPLYAGGFRQFAQEGLRYRNANHDHALTKTGPGHLTLLSGRHPGPAGVIANEFYDRTVKKIVYCVQDDFAHTIGTTDRGNSYRNVDATALGDWLKSSNTNSRVYSIAGKDRAAVLMGGKKPDGAFWFDAGTQEFTTSTYYTVTLPEFVRSFNSRRLPFEFVNRAENRTWDRVRSDKSLYRKYAGPDNAPGEGRLAEEDSPVFPHEVLKLTERNLAPKDRYGQLFSLPWLDRFTLEFASAVAEAEQLGEDADPDLLCVSLSAFDAIGHTFGPNSQEVMDAALRLDSDLDTFIAGIQKRAGKENVLFVLTSDHGAQPLVEYLQARGVKAARVNGEVRAFREKIFNAFKAKYPDAENLFLFRGQENISFDHDELSRRGVSLREAYGLVRREARTETWIAEIYDRDQLLSGKNLGIFGERMRHSFHPEKGADIYIIPKPNHFTPGGTFGRTGTSHGTPYEYDSHVPLIFLWPGLKPQAIGRAVRTIDLAPTLGRILGVKAPPETDGAVLIEVTDGTKSKN